MYKIYTKNTENSKKSDNKDNSKKLENIDALKSLDRIIDRLKEITKYVERHGKL